MSRFAIFCFSLLMHACFLGLYAYLAGFVGGFLVPKSIDSGAGPLTWTAVLVNLGLLCAFGLQHSLMARRGFKRWLTRMVPQAMERSVYVLAFNLVVVALIWFWQPIGGTVWQVENETARMLIWGLFAASWLSVPLYTFMINHFDLFGTRQAWRNLQGKGQDVLRFGTPGAYRFVRHPIYMGWTMCFWITPTMSVGHLIFAAGMTAYMLLAIPYEERDLVRTYGDAYRRYKDRVPGMLPLPGKGVRGPEELHGDAGLAS